MKIKSGKDVGCISKLFFWWLNDLLIQGYKRDLQEKDIANQLPNEDTSKNLGSKLFELWNNELRTKRPSLFRAARKLFGFEYILLGFLPLIEECCVRIFQPLLLGSFIHSLRIGSTPYLEGGLIIICSIINIFSTHWFYFSVQHIGMRVRIGISSLIYQSCLKQCNTPEGKLQNLLLNDVQRFDQSSVYIHYLWIAPLNLIIVFVILYNYYGISSFVGLPLLLLFTFLQAAYGVKFSKLRSKISSMTDQRLEFLCGMLKKMQQIKMHGLEPLYMKKCQILRKNELYYIKIATYLRSINLTFYYTGTKIVFMLIIWWHGKFELEKIFVTIALLNNVRSLMMNNFPNGITQLAEAKVAIRRIEEYLLGTAKNELPSTDKNVQISQQKTFVEVTNYKLKSNEFVNLNANSGDIINIVGGMNAGKTRFLQAILGEIKLNDSSNIQKQGSIAYIPQIPWIYPASMEENIIFNKPFDPSWYKEVLTACKLEDYGQISLDNMSGGMKARIGIARAVYSRADIYLFDDPFVALDSDTKSFVILECFLKLLEGKLRIIADGDGKLGKVINLDGITIDFKRPKSMALTGFEPSQSQLPVTTKRTISAEGELNTNSGSIGWKTYTKYFSYGTNCFGFLLLIIVNVGSQLSFSGGDYYLKLWASHSNFNEGMQIYGLIILCTVVIFIVRAIQFFCITLKSSANIHSVIFQRIINAKDESLQNYGKIMNCFGKDMSLLDEALPYTFFSAICIFFNVFGVIVITSIVQPFNLIPATILCIIFYFLRRFYIRTGRAIRRLEASGRSPLYSWIGSTKAGLSTIRCYNAQEKFLEVFNQRLDNHSRSWYINLTTSRWFAIYLDWISIVYTAVVIAGFLLGSHAGSDVGLAASSVLFLSAIFQLGARESATVENQMISVERVLEYLKIQTEDFSSGNDDYDVSGPIIFVIIEENDKVALIGQTGCGKSTILKALYRLIAYDGEITFSGVNSKNIQLKKLRSCLGIIPQEPYIFYGTIRQNIDPLDEFTDDEIYKVFERFKKFFNGIYDMVEEDGRNLSKGQKQLLSLIRVLVKRNKIIIMDEPPANLDKKTNALINKSFEEFCSKSTLITVAHRLRTIAHYNRALQIVDGEIKEADIPEYLRTNSTDSSSTPTSF